MLSPRTFWTIPYEFPASRLNRASMRRGEGIRDLVFDAAPLGRNVLITSPKSRPDQRVRRESRQGSDVDTGLFRLHPEMDDSNRERPARGRLPHPTRPPRVTTAPKTRKARGVNRGLCLVCAISAGQLPEVDAGSHLL